MLKKAKSTISFYSKYYSIERAIKGFKVSESYESKVLKLGELYDSMRDLSSYICNEELEELYKKMRSRIVDVERHVCSSEFIVESAPDFVVDDSSFAGGQKKIMTNEELLDFIVWLTRRGLVEDYIFEHEFKADLNDCTLANACFFSTSLVKSMCDAFNIRCSKIKIPAGFSDDIQLFDGHGYHYFALVTINDVDYIVDCSYRQFFRLDRNLIGRMGVYGLSGCDPGIYMLMDENRKRVAMQLLKRGWVEADKNNFKLYMDGFALAFRNGLYYENNKTCKFEVPYSFDDYKRFLSTADNQIELEGQECLGIQDKPLKDKDYCLKLK